MKKTFKIFLVSLVFLVGLVITNNVLADDITATNIPNPSNIQATLITSESDKVSEAILVDTNTTLTEQEKLDLIKEIENSKKGLMPQSDWAVVTFFAIRSGNTTSVEIIARYDSTTSAYQLWWDSITVQNLNLINKVTYKKFVNVHRVFPGSLGGTTSIGFVTVPKSETKVYIKTAGTSLNTYAYGWTSGIEFGGNVTMN